MNILLIDDDLDCLQSLAGFLKIDKHSCRMFTVPEQALETYQQEKYDVVITDMIMPGMNGIKVLQRIRDINRDAKVIIITGYLDPDIIASALNSQAYAFFSKPLKVNDLLATLEKIDRENREHEKINIEHARLALEYARLKIYCEDLQSSVKEKTASEEGST